MATIRKRGKGYQIRVSVGYDVTGKQLEKSMTWTPSPNMTEKQIEKEVNRQAVLFEEKCLTGQFLDGNITFAEFADRWFKDYAEKQLKEKSLDIYKNLMPRIIKSIGHIKLCKLQPHHLLEFYNNLAEKGIREDKRCIPCDNFIDILKQKELNKKELAKLAGVSVNTIYACCNGKSIRKTSADKILSVLSEKDLFITLNDNETLSNRSILGYHRFISSILTAAVQWQVIPFNPAQRLKPPTAEHKEAPVLDDSQTQKLIQCLENEPIKYRTAIMLILYTGLRRGELCALKWSDIDFDAMTVYVSKSLLYTPNKGVYEDTTKTRTSKRVIQIPSDMVELLKQYQTYQLKQRLLLGDLWQDTEHIFTSDIGTLIHPNSLTGWFKLFVKHHNLPDDVHIHTLRHISATLLIANGVDVATVSNRLGHTNKSTTLNIYTHAIKSADEKAAEKLQNIFKPSADFSIG